MNTPLIADALGAGENDDVLQMEFLCGTYIVPPLRSQAGIIIRKLMKLMHFLWFMSESSHGQGRSRDHHCRNCLYCYRPSLQCIGLWCCEMNDHVLCIVMSVALHIEVRQKSSSSIKISCLGVFFKIAMPVINISNRWHSNNYISTFPR